MCLKRRRVVKAFWVTFGPQILVFVSPFLIGHFPFFFQPLQSRAKTSMIDCHRSKWHNYNWMYIYLNYFWKRIIINHQNRSATPSINESHTNIKLRVQLMLVFSLWLFLLPFSSLFHFFLSFFSLSSLVGFSGSSYAQFFLLFSLKWL